MSPEYTGTPLSNPSVAGAGTGKTPCAHFTVPPPTFSGEQNSLNPQRFGANRRADDVDDGIHCADFVKVDLLDSRLL